jgi:hypothetical protein
MFLIHFKRSSSKVLHVRALRVSMVQHVETKIQAIRVNVLMDILVINVILEVSLFLNISWASNTLK